MAICILFRDGTEMKQENPSTGCYQTTILSLLLFCFRTDEMSHVLKTTAIWLDNKGDVEVLSLVRD